MWTCSLRHYATAREISGLYGFMELFLFCIPRFFEARDGMKPKCFF
tara:strand:- start:71166 stop:71303 length:138 start_codon:yes stop_codon:yes gene_type:complete